MMMFFIALVAVLQLAVAAPPYTNKITRGFSVKLTNADTGDCDSLIEDSPWKITNLAYFNANPTNESVSYVTFNFEDVNAGLELQTICSHYLPLASNGTLFDDKHYVCKNNSVQFKFTGSLLLLDRYYEDDCLGTAPWNSAIAHGRSNATLVKTVAPDGVLATQAEMHVPISSLT